MEQELVGGMELQAAGSGRDGVAGVDFASAGRAVVQMHVRERDMGCGEGLACCKLHCAWIRC